LDKSAFSTGSTDDKKEGINALVVAEPFLELEMAASVKVISTS
jgi:hypothetical protein